MLGDGLAYVHQQFLQGLFDVAVEDQRDRIALRLSNQVGLQRPDLIELLQVTRGRTLGLLFGTAS